ncbi:signal-regulatory protein beta-1-like [Bufo gargarizans]|uniref:signal-regulatory protein beta-1-like n=1 Tax=Bufo gargarizans TaxID=30331 RepID=UPI001CF2CB77|nr:signal-regulatory protein beta-1-like [Bufo gargarizans]
MSSLLLILLPLVTVVCAQLRITTSTAPIASETGSTAVLQCLFSLGVTPVDPAQVHVFWKHEGKKVLTYVERITAFRPGAHISEEELAKGDASLSLSNVTQEDAGLYTCSIRLGSEQVTQSMNLIVSEFRYISLEGTTVIMNKSNELRCSAHNLSSPEVTFTWMRDGVVLSTSTPHLVEGSHSEGFKVQGSFCFTPVLGDVDDKAYYSCQVVQKIFPPLKKTFQLSIGVQPEVFFYLSSQGQKNSSIICLVSGFYPDDLNLSMKRDGELLGCKIHKWRNANGTYSLEATYRTNVTYSDNKVDYTCTVHHPSIPDGTTERLTFLVNDISTCKDWTEGSTAVLKCSIAGRYPKTITAVWLIRQGDKEIEIKEKGSLYTAGDYKELQEQDSYKCWNIIKSRFVGGIRHSLCSILSFQVDKERHDQAEFICRFMRAGKILQEKKYIGSVPDSYGFYSVSDICAPETCNEGEKLTLSCIMRGNIPRDISVTWEKSLNEERTLILMEEDANYQVTENKSQGQICAFLTLCPSCDESGAVFTASFSENEGRILAERSSAPLKVAETKNNWSRTYQDWGFRAFDESVITEM